jgi:hypothetical protein
MGCSLEVGLSSFPKLLPKVKPIMHLYTVI